MSQNNPPDFKMTLGGVDFSSKEMSERVVEIQVEQIADGPDYFKVTLDDRDGYWVKSQKIKEEDSASVALGYHNEGTIPVITGQVTGVETFRREYRRQTFVVRGFDGMHRLTRGRHQRTWEDVKDSDLAGIMAGEAGLGCETDDSEIIHPYVAQRNVTNLVFLFDRARRIGFEVDVHENTLRFKKAELAGPTQTMIWDESNMAGGGGRLLKRCQFSSSTMGIINKVIVRSWDPDIRKEIVGMSGDIHGQTMGGQKTAAQWAPASTMQVSCQPVRSAAEAEKMAWSLINQRAGAFMTGFGSCEGDGKIKAGKTVKVEFVGAQFDGEYYVARANHRLRMGAGPGNGYETEFEIRRSGR